MHNLKFRNEIQDFILIFTSLFLSYLIIFYSVDLIWFKINPIKFYIWSLLIIISFVFICIKNFFSKNSKTLYAEFSAFFFIAYLLFGLISSFVSGTGAEWYINTLLIFLLCLGVNSKFKYSVIFMWQINLLFLFSIVLVTFYLSRNFYELNNLTNLYGLFTLVNEETGLVIPRSTGISRMLGISCIILIFTITFLLKNKITISIALIIIFIIPSSLIIYFFGSRFGFGGLFLSLSISVCLYRFSNNVISFIIIILGIIITFYIIINLFDYGHLGGKDYFNASGRIKIWRQILFNDFNFSFIGYGFQADRYIYSLNASNLYVYSYLSSGFLGLMSIILSILITYFNLFKYILICRNKNYKIRFLSVTSFTVATYLLMRSIVENSFSVANIDVILWSLVINTSLYLKNSYHK